MTKQKDITEQKKISESLHESEERYRALFDRTLFCVYVHDFQGRFLDANQAALDLLGYTKEEIPSINFATILDKTQVKEALQRIRMAAKGEGEGQPTIYRLRKKDGSQVIVEAESSLLYMNNKPFAIQGIARDITEKKRMETELKQERDFALQVMNNIGQGLTVVDKNGRFEYVNPAYAKMIGLKPEELIGKTPFEFTITEDHEALSQATDRRKNGHTNTYETRLRRIDGNEVHVIITGVPRLKDGEYTGSFAVITDLTEKITMEKELQRTQKLESLGTLAGGIAHDFNNLLTGILGHISLARLKIKNREHLIQSLNKAEEAAKETKNLTQYLLTFAKGGEPQKKVMYITELIKEAVSFALRGSIVKCSFDLPDNLWQAEVDVDQMNQVINNLIINADQAMPEGGIIQIHGENITVKQKTGSILSPGRFLKITIEDTGIGIPEDHIKKIFDPYFTTKQKGRGLGLSTCYSIIKKHNGFIEAHSRFGKGTAVMIYLPEARKKGEEKKESQVKKFTKKARVLIMDDEELIRDAAGAMLEYLGLETESAPDGEEALKLYQAAMKKDHPFDVVIMDLTIPGGMGGKETIKRLLKIDPKARVIVSSGYSNDPIIAHFKDYGFKGSVVKPYKIEELCGTLEKVLAEKR